MWLFILGLMAVGLSGQTQGQGGHFQPTRLHNVTFVAALAYGHVVELPSSSDSGTVPLQGRFIWVQYPGPCWKECKVIYYLVLTDPEGVDAPDLWGLGTGKPPVDIAWLPPTTDMPHHSARLRVRFAEADSVPTLQQREAGGVEFVVTEDTVRVLSPSHFP